MVGKQDNQQETLFNNVNLEKMAQADHCDYLSSQLSTYKGLRNHLAQYYTRYFERKQTDLMSAKDYRRFSELHYQGHPGIC